MTDRVAVAIDDRVAHVRLTRPDKMNALDGAMFQALLEAGDVLKQDTALRAVVLSGAGRAFCAGLDLADFSRMADGERGGIETLLRRDDRIANSVQQACLVWRQIPVPVIAAVHGVAFGGGFQLALGADMRYVTADARMAIREIEWGLVPDMAGTLLMNGLARADVIRELTFTGRIFTGVEALKYGFATRVCEDPFEDALKTAREIAAKSPHAIRAGKRLLNLAAEGDAATVLREETAEQTALLGSTNQREAVMANMQKREPRFADVEQSAAIRPSAQ